MPIYAYRCETCGHAKDVLQKISDEPLQQCPACGASTFRKQVTAAGFQLKGSGWYVTDFRDKASSRPAGETADKSSDKPAEKAGDSAAGAASPAADKPAAAPSPAPAASSPPPASGS